MTQTPVSTLQPSLTLTEFLDTSGVFPTEGGAGSGPFLGSIGLFAGPALLFNAAANGQTYPIAANAALFSILGTTFGGNGASNFQLPNLGGIQTIGAGQGAGLPEVDLGQTIGQTNSDLTMAQLPPSLGGTSAAIDTQQPSLGLNYVINTEGVFPSGDLTLNSLGVVSAFAGNFAPGGELFCDGQLLPISEFSALFNLIGTTYGGNGVTTFALPDLRGRDIVGAGDGFTLGEQVGRRECDAYQRQFSAGLGRAGRKPAARSGDELLYCDRGDISLGGRDRKSQSANSFPRPDRRQRRDYSRPRGLGAVRRPIALDRRESGLVLCAGDHLWRKRRHDIRPAEFAGTHRAGHGRLQRTGRTRTGQRRERDHPDKRRSARSRRSDDWACGRHRGR